MTMIAIRVMDINVNVVPNTEFTVTDLGLFDFYVYLGTAVFF